MGVEGTLAVIGIGGPVKCKTLGNIYQTNKVNFKRRRLRFFSFLFFRKKTSVFRHRNGCGGQQFRFGEGALLPRPSAHEKRRGCVANLYKPTSYKPVGHVRFVLGGEDNGCVDATRGSSPLVARGHISQPTRPLQGPHLSTSLSRGTVGVDGRPGKVRGVLAGREGAGVAVYVGGVRVAGAAGRDAEDVLLVLEQHQELAPQDDAQQRAPPLDLAVRSRHLRQTRPKRTQTRRRKKPSDDQGREEMAHAIVTKANESGRSGGRQR
eukprot:239941-Prorocentrum_minimum.AAC.9